MFWEQNALKDYTDILDRYNGGVLPANTVSKCVVLEILFYFGKANILKWHFDGFDFKSELCVKMKYRWS